MSGAEGAEWYMEQEESSHPRHSEHGQSNRQNPPHGWFARRERDEVDRLPSYHHFSKRMELGGDPQLGNALRRPDVPSLLVVGPTCATVLKIGNSFERGSLPTFATLFNREILEAPRLSKVKMPSIELFD